MIERPTASQEARYAEFRDKWVAIGLSTAPAQRERAEEAVRQSYRCAGLSPPARIVWCGSPLSVGLTRAVIMDTRLVYSIMHSVVDSFGASVWASVWASVMNSVRDSVVAGASVGASVRASIYGQHEAGRLSFYEFFRVVCGLVPETDRLVGLNEWAQSAGWGLPHRNICWISERHHILQRDGRGLLHSLTGPALMYPDGLAIYAVHGVRVPATVIEAREHMTVQDILAESNAEIRRVKLEVFGWQRFARETRARQLDADVDATGPRELLCIDLPDDEPLVYVSVTDPAKLRLGLAAMTLLRVPPRMRTCREAVAWTFGREVADYTPSVET